MTPKYLESLLADIPKIEVRNQLRIEIERLDERNRNLNTALNNSVSCEDFQKEEAIGIALEERNRELLKANAEWLPEIEKKDAAILNLEARNLELMNTLHDDEECGKALDEKDAEILKLEERNRELEARLISSPGTSAYNREMTRAEAHLAAKDAEILRLNQDGGVMRSIMEAQKEEILKLRTALARLLNDISGIGWRYGKPNSLKEAEEALRKSEEKQ